VIDCSALAQVAAAIYGRVKPSSSEAAALLLNCASPSRYPGGLAAVKSSVGASADG